MKKIIFLFSFILFTTLLITACQPAPTPTAEPTKEQPTVEPTKEVVVEPTKAPEPTAEPPIEPPGCLGTAKDAMVDLKCRKVTVAIENAYLPFNYVDAKTGEPGGWDYETWDEICRRLHCTPVYTEAAWEGMIQAVSDGQYDAAADGVTITKDRAEIVDFSMGYINIEQRLLVRIGETRFKSIEELAANKDLVIGTQTGTTNYESATKYLPETRIKAFEQFPFAVQALIGNDIDAVIIDETAGQGYLGENRDKVELIGPSISSDQLGFLFPKGSDLVEPVNNALKAMMEDGTLTKFNIKYFGPDFDMTYDDIQ
ncbi:MAG: transporter substrate-binding domain-containing protein [Anaerolineales bacterium]|nr:transporter substrate-binding domain-containing protein [Anaerolineales bacterium]